ncbi:MAG: hypothetical protein ACYCO3_11210, partial [Mycobacteriales bacterium]
VQAELLDELAHRAGISDEEIARDVGQAYVERGLQNWAWVQATGRLISRRIPWLSEQVLALFLRDVDAYLTCVDVRLTVWLLWICLAVWLAALAERLTLDHFY